MAELQISLNFSCKTKLLSPVDRTGCDTILVVNMTDFSDGVRKVRDQDEG